MTQFDVITQANLSLPRAYKLHPYRNTPEQAIERLTHEMNRLLNEVGAMGRAIEFLKQYKSGGQTK